MLNYAYAVLLTEMRIKAITDGFDPTIGILHDKRVKREKRTPSFALDLMEPLRPVVDRAVLRLVAKRRSRARISNCSRMGFVGSIRSWGAQ
jgi:CRISP-associated protein Cas1